MSIVYHTATDQRVEQSLAEQAFIAALQAAGVPVVPSVKLGNNWVFDGAVNGTRLLVEFHGGHWHSRPEVVERDARKATWAQQEGYQIAVVWDHEFAADPGGTVARVAEQARQAAAAADPTLLRHDESDTPPVIAPAHYGDWRDVFLAVLAESGIVREATIAAGVSRQTAYAARREDAVFAEHWRLALQDAADKALIVYRRRALQQSDRAMEFFITTRDPEIRTPPSRVELTGAEGGPIDVSTMSDAERAERIAGIVARARQRANTDPDGQP